MTFKNTNEGNLDVGFTSKNFETDAKNYEKNNLKNGQNSDHRTDFKKDYGLKRDFVKPKFDKYNIGVFEDEKRDENRPFDARFDDIKSDNFDREKLSVEKNFVKNMERGFTKNGFESEDALSDSEDVKNIKRDNNYGGKDENYNKNFNIHQKTQNEVDYSKKLKREVLLFIFLLATLFAILYIFQLLINRHNFSNI